MPKTLTIGLIKEWLALVDGVFDIRQCWAEIGIDTPEGKNHLRVILYRIEHTEGSIVSLGSGKYRKVDNQLEVMDWQAADTSKTVDLRFPFKLEDYCKIYPKSVIILAGSKNEGKTAFLYDFIVRNMGSFIIDLYNSETGPEQMKERFEPLNVPSPPPFNSYMRYDNFADVINPEHISVIDYLDLNSEVYLVGTEIDNIFRKLTTGCAIIGLQKPPPTVTFTKSGVKKLVDRDLAYGGGFTAKRSVLYISLSSHKLKLVYVKTPANPKIKPDNKQWSYSFNDVGYFSNIHEYYGEEY